MAEEGDNNNVFIYMGGDQEFPRDVRYVRVHKSVKIIRQRAFRGCIHLVSIEMHDGVEIIEKWAFECCRSLGRIKVPGVRVIGNAAFFACTALEDVEFGNKLETIGSNSFACTSLRSIKLPKIRVIEEGAFADCGQLTGVELSEDLERIGGGAFVRCRSLRRIALPLKNNIFGEGVFYGCDDLSQVDLVGGIHKTISSFLLESWKNETHNAIDRMNQDLPNSYSYEKSVAICRWMERVIRRIARYKSEHYALVKEFTALLELALWDANLQQQEERLWLKWVDSKQPAKKAKIDIGAIRHEARVKSGANIVIKNVLPFLKLE